MSSADERLRKLTAGASPPKKKTRRRPTKKTPTAHPVDLTLLEEMSESELVAVARLVGYPTASRRLLPEDLISLILGEVDEPPEDPLVDIREKIFDFVDGNQRILRSQMSCDLHCPTCPHHKVVECYTVNQDKVG
jgi:hypothetical protein